MTPSICLTPAINLACLKVSALLQDPVVELAPDPEGGMPVLTVEEGGALVQFEFPDEGCFLRFRDRISSLDFGRAA